MLECACTGSVGWCTGACADPSRQCTGLPGRACWVGIPGEYYQPTQPAAVRSHRRPVTAGNGPLSWQGWVGCRWRGLRGSAAGTGIPTLRARSCPPVGTPWDTLSECRLWAYRARLTVISCKVSQNDEVSPVLVEKASRSPYIPKRVPEVTS